MKEESIGGKGQGEEKHGSCWDTRSKILIQKQLLEALYSVSYSRVAEKPNIICRPTEIQTSCYPQTYTGVTLTRHLLMHYFLILTSVENKQYSQSNCYSLPLREYKACTAEHIDQRGFVLA